MITIKKGWVSILFISLGGIAESSQEINLERLQESIKNIEMLIEKEKEVSQKNKELTELFSKELNLFTDATQQEDPFYYLQKHKSVFFEQPRGQQQFRQIVLSTHGIGISEYYEKHVSNLKKYLKVIQELVKEGDEKIRERKQILQNLKEKYNQLKE